MVTNAGEHLTCHSRNGNHRTLHSHQDGILHNLHIPNRARQQPWVRPQPHACHSIPCRVLHSRSCGIHQDRIHHIRSRAQPRPHACHRNPCCSQGCIHHIHGIRRIHHSQSRAQQQPWAQPQPHACRSILRRDLHIHSCGIHRIHQGRSLVAVVRLSSSLGFGL